MKAAGMKGRDSYRIQGYTDFRSDGDDSVMSGLDRMQSAKVYDLKGQPRTVSERKLDANSYFHSYESMVRSQDVEDIATIAHLRPIFGRIQRFGRSDSLTHNSNHSGLRDTSFTADHDDTFQGHSKQDGKSTSKALWTNEKAGAYTKADAYTPAQTIDAFSSDSMCDPRELLTFASLKRFATTLKSFDFDSANDENKVHDAPAVNSDFYFIQSDEQLMMIILKFEEAIDDWRRDPRCRAIDLDEAGITFSEFVHVYKTVISGMKSLQMIPSLHQFTDDKNESIVTLVKMSEDMKDLVSYQREKTVERSLKMINEFTHFSSFSPVAVISSSDDDNDKFGSDDNFSTRAQDVLNTTQASLISRSVCITPESERKLKPVQDNAAPIVEISASSSIKMNDLRITPDESLSNLNMQKITRKTSLKDRYYWKFSVLGILIVVACASGVARQRIMAWLTPLKTSSYISPLYSSRLIEVNATWELEMSREQQLKISLDDTTKSRQKSEDKLAKAITRIGTMALQLEDLNDEVREKNNALSLCEDERVAHLGETSLYPFYRSYMDCCTEQPTSSPANVLHASISDESDGYINLDSQKSVSLDQESFTMKDMTRQRTFLSAEFVTRRFSNTFRLAAKTVKRTISRLRKFDLAPKLLQTAMSAFARFFTKN